MSQFVFFIISFLLGIFVSASVIFSNLYIHFLDYGGTIMIDEDTRVNRIDLNDAMDDWPDQKWIIFKVAKSDVKLKRIGKTDPMSLEDEK